MTGDTDKRLDDLEAKFDALNRARVDIYDRLDAIEDKVDTLLKTVDTTPERVAFEDMGRARKVHKLRRYVLEQAHEQGGEASMGYREIKSLFDGHPSDGHAYDLMGYAAQIAGFAVKDDPKRLVVKTEDVNDTALIHAVKNDTKQEAY